MRALKSKVSTANRPAPLAGRLRLLSAKAYRPRWEIGTVRLKPGSESRKNSASVCTNATGTVNGPDSHTYGKQLIFEKGGIFP